MEKKHEKEIAKRQLNRMMIIILVIIIPRTICMVLVMTIIIRKQ